MYLREECIMSLLADYNNISVNLTSRCVGRHTFEVSKLPLLMKRLETDFIFNFILNNKIHNTTVAFR
jgi:hypothetical protein